MYFILYVSKATDQCSDAEIADILQASRTNNSANGVTGILVHKEPDFIQFLEGPEEVVMALYDKIKNDPRHGTIKTIDQGETKERIFPNWEMGFAGEGDLQPLQWKWDLDKLTLFSLADNMGDSMEVIRSFIGVRPLDKNAPGA
ncbi:MAG: BLUF domain-containing protein [Boseongicola sp.]|nr:BLUF domain-containing protein [Boseongicola sp.]